MLRALARLILVPLAFVLAAAMAGFVLVTLGQERIIQGLGGRRPENVTLGAAFDLINIAQLLFSFQTLAPALTLVLVGEVARIRQSMYYVLGGGVAMAAVPLILRLSQGGVLTTSAVVWQVFATAGFAGGFVYWLVAGRSA
jgi:hypothetical protein